MMARIGYARVSSGGQSLDVQLEKLAGCKKVYQEKASASGKRPQLDACFENIRDGDTLVVTSLDCLARSTLDLCRVAEQLQRDGVHLQVIDQNINTNDATGRLLFNMLETIAQLETEIRAECQKVENKLSRWSAVRNRQIQEKQLIEQYFMNLEVEYAKQKQYLNGKFKTVCEKIENLFKDHTWRNAYHIELLIVNIYDEITLESKLSRKLIEATHLSPIKRKYYNNAIAKETSLASKRTLLGELLKDLQWFYQKRHAKRSYTNIVRIRALFVFIVVSIITVLLLPPWLEEFLSIFLQWFGYRVYYLFSVIGSSALGAAFSTLISVRRRLESSTLDEVEVLQRYSYLVSRIFVGIGAGIIFFYFVQGGLLQGQFFPTLHMDNGENFDFKYKDLSLLIVWCFISGFSEQLVPNILSKTEERTKVSSSRFSED